MPADNPIHDLALAAIDADAQIDDLLPSDAEHGRIAFSTLYAYANDPDFVATPAFEKRLTADEAAMADLERLLENTSQIYMPKLAAASSGSVQKRETDDAVITLTTSRAEPEQIFVKIELKDSDIKLPAHLFARSGDGPWIRMALPAFMNTRTQILLSADDRLINILRSPDGQVYLR